jgi:regulator of sirC expression with transglutaminase-like and TPR domain
MATTQFDNKELEALIRMLDEPDEAVFNHIRNKVIEYGPVAIPFLEESWMQLSEEKEIARVEEMMGSIRLNDTFENLKLWAEGGSISLLEPYLLISAFHEPGFNLVTHKKSVEKIIQDVWLEMNDSLTALEKIRVVNHVLYKVYGFRGLAGQTPKLATYILSNLLRIQKGNPLSLGLLYLIVAQSVNLPVFGVNLPTHFILVYMDDFISLKQAKDYTRDEVLFYLNPFNKGALFRSSEIALFLKQLKIKESPEFFLPGDNLTIIRRLMEEMIILHLENKNQEKAKDLKYLLTALG